MNDHLEIVYGDIVIVAVVLAVLVLCAEYDASSAENATEQSGGDEVDVFAVNESCVGDIADDVFASYAVKPVADHFVNVGVGDSYLKCF